MTDRVKKPVKKSVKKPVKKQVKKPVDSKYIQYRKSKPKGSEKHEFQVNLPGDWLSYRKGNGEGVWAVALNQKDYNKWKRNAKQGIIKVMILNKSFNYPILKWGSTFDVELRGQNRPVLNKQTLQYVFDYYDIPQEDVKDNPGVFYRFMEYIGIY